MEALLTQLKLARIREVWEEWLARAAAEEMSYADFLKGLLMEEVCARKENQLKRYRHQANFPFEKTIEQFDFSLRPGLKRQVFLNLLDVSFVHQARSLILLGPSGTGKTHLAIAVAMRMIQLGYQAKFLLAQKLVNDYVNQPLSRTKMMNQLAKVDLLIIDEFGYLPYDAQAGPWFYQLISDR
jgi:DNA replication protein DnaC